MKKFLIVLVMLLLPSFVFAKGAIVGYYQTAGGTAPTSAMLDKLTHVILFQVYPSPDGSSLDLKWMGLTGNSLTNFVTSAHNKGVKVIVAAGGAGGSTANFMNATSDANRPRFVAALKSFVEQYNLDGVDLDWETQVNWQQWADLCLDLKTAMPSKRISGTLGADSPDCQYGNHFTQNATIKAYFQKNIWKIDAVQLMTYDMHNVWPTPADLAKSKECIDKWAQFGNGQPQFSKEKLFIGCHSQQDNAASIKGKIEYCQTAGYGGAILWEITSSNQTAFLDVAYTQNVASGGYNGGGELHLSPTTT